MKNQKIEDFISKLVDPNLPEDQQSYILTADEVLDSAGDNADNCSNSSASSCGGKSSNGNCTNFKVCGGATNFGTCKNFEPITIDSECVIPANPSGNCG